MRSQSCEERPWSFTTAYDGTQDAKRVRFNLLVLEHGEYYIQDYGVYFYPCDATAATAGGLRYQGRLKLCSRGLVFESADFSLPLLKLPFRFMDGAIQALDDCSFRVPCRRVVELKAGDEIGPYTVKKQGDRGESMRYTFSLLHTRLDEFLPAVHQFREVSLGVKEKGYGHESILLEPALKARLPAAMTFDTSHLVDFRETLLLSQPMRADRITPLLRLPGCLMITNSRVYFQPADLNNVGEAMVSFPHSQVERLAKRRYLLRQTGLELFLEDGMAAYFSFDTVDSRDRIFSLLMQQPLIGPRVRTKSNLNEATKLWQSGEMDNFSYLAFLNTMADRSVNDLTQYPVFPWVIQDYTSQQLDLTSPQTFRDLSKPIGALNAERLHGFRARFSAMPEESTECGIPPPFLYGTHYSTPGYVLYYLVRAAPEHMLCLQNGRFDSADRMFASVGDTWQSVLTNPADVKELIPEFYSGQGVFLKNSNDLPLGFTQTGERLGDVELPPWASSAEDFIFKNREALESEHVSQHLHEWIDLIFGARQRGPAAVEADNLFYHLTYDDAVHRLEATVDVRERAALESQVEEFGQCPLQLFTRAHPSRHGGSLPRVAAGAGAGGSVGSVGSVAAAPATGARLGVGLGTTNAAAVRKGLASSMRGLWGLGKKAVMAPVPPARRQPPPTRDEEGEAVQAPPPIVLDGDEGFRKLVEQEEKAAREQEKG